MPAAIEAPIDFVEAMADLCFPPELNARAQALMDRNNDGRLTEEEKRELAALAELSEKMSLVRAEAFRMLGRSPV